MSDTQPHPHAEGGPAKVCPNCGSEDVTIMTQTENNEAVCAADVCQECDYQWNVG